MEINCIVITPNAKLPMRQKMAHYLGRRKLCDIIRDTYPGAKLKLDDSVFISLGLKTETKAPALYRGLSRDVLIQLLDQADKVVIISAYYDIPFLKQLFERKRSLKDLTMVFARAAASARGEQVQELREFRQWLRSKHNRKSSINIKIAEGRRFLHTKVYQFQRGKWARTLIGSANATAAGFFRNDELLVEIHGRNHAIEGYVDWTVSQALCCEDDRLKTPEEYNSLQALLRDGFVYFRSTRTIPYTLNCFDNYPDIIAKLQKAVLANPLPFHDEQSAGLLNILRLFDINVEDDQREVVRPVRIVPFSVETCFGFWVPFAFRTMLDARIDASVESKTAVFSASGLRLASIDRKEAAERIHARYFDEIDKRLMSVQSAPLTSAQRHEVEVRLIRRIESLKELLTNGEQCKRLARPLTGTPVPEIWEDPRSKREMVDSFCEYLSWKLARSGRIPGVVRKMKEWFDLRGGEQPEEIREKIDSYFESGQTKSRKDWLGTDLDETE